MSAYHTNTNCLRTVTIQEIKEETPTIKTLFFNDKPCAKSKPGQFLMIWIPGVDEIPMSISSANPNGTVSITTAKVGEATEALHKKKPQDIIGVRGPFGNGFTLTNGKVLIVGGGTGIAPLVFLAEKLAKSSTSITFLLGAKTKAELLFLNRVKNTLTKANSKIIATTEDGSYGFKGLITHQAKQILEKENFNMIYTCGPEKMMYEIFRLARKYNVPLQASLERLMRCAIGLCGSCIIGKYRVCRDGPVFSNEQLSEAEEEFGQLMRDFNGRKVKL